MRKTGKLSLITVLLLAFSSSVVISAPAPADKSVKTNVTAEEKKKLQIFSDEAKYDRQNQVALATGHVKIIQEDATIYTWAARYEEKIKTSFIDTFVRIVNLDKESNRTTNISANKMIAYHSEKKVHMENDVRFDRAEDRKVQPANPNLAKRDKIENAVRKERTIINSDLADYWTRSGDAVFTGNVVVLQKEKRIDGDTVVVRNDENKNTDTITIDKNARMIQIRGDWLVKEGVIENPDEDKEKERLVKERLEMKADRIVIYQKTSNLTGTGNVVITQKVSNKQRMASGDKAVFSDADQTLTLIGNVKIKRENEDWLTAEKAVFHTDSENFEAYGTIDPNAPKDTGKEPSRVKSEFVIPDEENPEPELPIGTPEPEFNLEEKSPPKVIPGNPANNKPQQPASPVNTKPQQNQNPAQAPKTPVVPDEKPKENKGEFTFPE